MSVELGMTLAYIAAVVGSALIGAFTAGLIMAWRPTPWSDEALEEMLEQVNGELYLRGLAEGCCTMKRTLKGGMDDSKETDTPSGQEPGGSATEAVPDTGSD